MQLFLYMVLTMVYDSPTLSPPFFFFDFVHLHFLKPTTFREPALLPSSGK